MKHILPVLTVTALAAAASAQVAPAPAAKQSLSYNRVVASWVSTTGSCDTGVSVFAQAKLGGGFYVSAVSTDLATGIVTPPIGPDIEVDADATAASIGFAQSLPSFLGVATDLNLEVGRNTLGAGLRALIGGGVELGVAYSRGAGSSLNDTLTVSASYNLGFLVKGLSLNASYASETGTGVDPLLGLNVTNASVDTTSIGIGYNF